MRQPDLFHLAALRVIRELPDYRSLSYLELGCGDGGVLDALHREGVTKARGTTFRERSTDYIRSRDYPEHVQVDGGLDLNKPLPYPNASFDVVYSTEVIEHVEGHRNFLAEAARVLRPGGWLVLTTPNLHRILSRVWFALSGVHMTKQALIPWTYDLKRMEEFHHRCIDFPLVHWLLWRSGMRIEAIMPTQVYFISRLALVLKPLMAPLVRKQVMRHVTPDAEDCQARQDLVKWMAWSSPLLSSEQLCLKARKVSGNGPAAAAGAK